ncbi:MAG: ATP synthase F1 subunit epsilon [Cyanobacteria bacterium SIG32]|nr:ATP synthase F1 subunit epsilon [Cyanobacteria bacterium SIG32]
MHLKIITHERVVFDEDVDEIYSKGVNGEFGILKGHIPYMTALDIGVTKVVQDKNSRFFTTMGGVFQFKDEEALILTECAECGKEIDEVRAREALERAKARLAEADAKLDAKRAEAAIARAMARLKAKLNE